MIRTPLRIPVTVGSVSSYAEIADPDFVIRNCKRIGCPICSRISYWLQQRDVEEKQVLAAVEESSFVMVA
jgi:hypothetical protein